MQNTGNATIYQTDNHDEEGSLKFIPHQLEEHSPKLQALFDNVNVI